MTFWELAFVSWVCLGDWRVLGLSGAAIPASARPAAAAVGLCRVRPEVERHPARAAAERRVLELGPSAAPRLRWCQRLKCFDREIVWKDRAVIDGRTME